MTEAVRPTGASMHPSTGAISGEVLMTPISLDRAINVTPGIPSASSGNLSHDMMGGPSLREKAAALTLALGMLGGAKLVFDSQSAKGQSPSPAPSEGPITGAVDPCASPEPSPSPSPTPASTQLAEGPRKAFIARGLNANGERVTVRLSAQEAPSAAPASNAAEASEAPASFVPVDRNGDGVIDEKDTETAAIDCEPTPTPEASASPVAPKTPEPTPAFATLGEMVDIIANQDLEDIKPMKIGKLENKIKAFIKSHEEELSTFRTSGGRALTEEYIDEIISKIKHGLPELQGESPESVYNTRRIYAAGLTKTLITLADWSKLSETKTRSLNLADNVFDYGVAGVDSDNNQRDLKEMKYNLRDMFAA